MGTAPDASGLVLLPRPRHLEVLGLGPPSASCPVASAVDPTTPAEGFTLTITAAAGARITHRDDAGLRYARALLDQLLAQPVDGHVVAVRIEDRPDLAVRGFMLDISRDRVPTRATLERYVEVLALARYNQLQLYIEHTFAHVGHDQVWAEASPLTADELRWLDDRCAAVGIELVANRNCFGHFERWLARPAYRDRAEAPDGVEIMAGLRFPAAVLAPTADNAAFALGLVREQLACLRSKRVNIGCDETFELGRGASAAACAARGTGAVYVEHLRRLADPLLAEGYQVQVWADVLRRHPDLVAGLPEGIVPVAWLYEAPCEPAELPELPAALVAVLDDLGVDTDTSGGFAANVAPLVDAGIGFWVAPGTGDWNSLVGRWDNAVANQLDAARVAAATGAAGYLVTAWGDNGHHHPPAVTFAAAVHGGAVAWGAAANADLDMAGVLDRFVFLDDTGRLGEGLLELGRLHGRTGRRAFNASPLAGALFPHLPLVVTGRPDPDAIGGLIADLESAVEAVASSRPRCADADEVVAELTMAAGLARQGAWRLSGGAGPAVEDRRADLAGLIDAFDAAWLARARPGGLPDSRRHLERTLAADDAAPTGTDRG